MKMRRVLATIGVIIAIALVVVAAKPLLVLFGGLLFALVLHGIATPLAKKTGIPRGAWVGALVVILLASTVVGIVLAGPTLREQTSELAKRIPQLVHDIMTRVREHPVSQALGPPPGNNGPDTQTVAAGTFAAIGGTLDVLGACVVVFFVGFYGALRPQDYVRAVLTVTPRCHRLRVRRAMHHATHDLTRWLLGRLVAMLFVGVTCAIAFSVLKVPLALTLAILAGLLTFVEYVGAIISAIPPVLLAFTRSPTVALAVLIVFTVLHVIEGYVLTPLLARASVRLPPAFTLAGQVVFATLVGPLGLTFSTPLLVVGVSAFQALRGERRRSTKHVRVPREQGGRPRALGAVAVAKR